MGMYREAYPYGGASASAAYHYSGALLPSHRPHEALMGLPYSGEGGRLLAVPGSGSVYGFDNLPAAGASAILDAAFDPSRNNGGLLSEIHSQALPARYGNIGGASFYDSDLHGRTFSAEPYSQVSADSHIQTLQGSEVGALYGRSFYPGVRPASLLSARTNVRMFGNTLDTLVGNEPPAKQKPPSSSQALGSVGERRRKTPTLDALIKETWELHSLFRAGSAAASKGSESRGNGAEDILRKRKRAKEINGPCDTGGKWGDTPLREESHPDSVWYVPSDGAFDTTSSWEELDDPGKKKKGTPSNNKNKDSSPIQEQYASKLQRFTCERVAEFMKDFSDSEDDSFVESDDDVPNILAESSQTGKSREEQAYDFFLQTFQENKELQKLYYEQCFVGRFECLVCSSIPGKAPKKYNGLISVIMHASKILKTKKKQEHRGYARALCSCMGWDFCRLPTMPRSSSPNPRCCIPADEEKNTDVEKNEEALKESGSGKSEGTSDTSGSSENSEEINAGVENASED